jgi:hypothetical protein
LSICRILNMNISRNIEKVENTTICIHERYDLNRNEILS